MSKKGFGFVVVLILFVFFGLVGRMETTYRNEAKVVKVDRTEGEVLFEDGRGNIWSIDYEEGFREGERVKLIMDTNFTDEIIEDDIILKVKR